MKKLKEKLSAKLSKNGGFTLAEMLIVVAIIAVLVAVSIPIFSSQLERAREATDLANIRAAYAEIMTHAIAEETTNLNSTVTSDGTITYDATNKIYTAVVKANQTDANKWETANNGIKVASMTTGATYSESKTLAPSAGTYTITFKVDTQKLDIKTTT